MKIYTKTGDSGFSNINNQKIPKYDDIFHMLGNLDMINSSIGLFLAHLSVEDMEIIELCMDIQKNIMVISSYLSGYINQVENISEHLLVVEQAIDSIDSKNTPLVNFILPGGNLPSSYAHSTRAIIRSSERFLVLFMENKNFDMVVLKYINRLSDLFFVIARYCNDCGKNDIPWIN